MYFLELHDSQIESVVDQSGQVEIWFSKAWLHPAVSYRLPVEKLAQTMARVRMTLSEARIDGSFPDFEEDSYLSSGHLTLASNGQISDIHVPSSIAEPFSLTMIFIMGETVTLTGNQLQTELIAIATFRPPLLTQGDPSE